MSAREKQGHSRADKELGSVGHRGWTPTGSQLLSSILLRGRLGWLGQEPGGSWEQNWVLQGKEGSDGGCYRDSLAAGVGLKAAAGDSLGLLGNACGC